MPVHPGHVAVPLTDPIKTPENQCLPQRSVNLSADLRQEDRCNTPSPEAPSSPRSASPWYPYHTENGSSARPCSGHTTPPVLSFYRHEQPAQYALSSP